jgi:hypothetical protein
MKEDSTIELDPRDLLGLSQVAKVSGKQAATGRLLNKVGGRRTSGYSTLSALPVAE